MDLPTSTPKLKAIAEAVSESMDCVMVAMTPRSSIRCLRISEGFTFICDARSEITTVGWSRTTKAGVGAGACGFEVGREQGRACVSPWGERGGGYGVCGQDNWEPYLSLSREYSYPLPAESVVTCFNQRKYTVFSFLHLPGRLASTRNKVSTTRDCIPTQRAKTSPGVALSTRPHSKSIRKINKRRRRHKYGARDVQQHSSNNIPLMRNPLLRIPVYRRAGLFAIMPHIPLPK